MNVWLKNMINVCKTLGVLMRCVPVIAPAPGCRPHTGHISPAGARLSQKHCKNFSNLKPCKFSSRLSSQPGGGGYSGGVIAKYLRNVPRLGPLCIYLRQVRNTGLARSEGGEGCEYVLSKFASSHGSAGPALLAKLWRQETVLFADTGLRWTGWVQTGNKQIKPQ